MVSLIDEVGEDLVSTQRMMLAQQRGGKKEDTRIYWKRPQVNQDGRPDVAAGWVFWASDDMKSTRFSEQWMTLGWTPLPKYGNVSRFGDAGSVIDLINAGKLPQNCPDRYGPWGRILCHPDGPAEFPLEQILTYRWYDPDRCPVPGVRWPQLKGIEIEEYECPECNAVLFSKPVHLARHLRNTHNYDRSEVAAFGQEVGIDFGREVRRTAGRRVYTYDEQEFIKEIEAAPVIEPPLGTIIRRQVAGRAGRGRENNRAGGPVKGSLEAKLRMQKARAARSAKLAAVPPQPA